MGKLFKTIKYLIIGTFTFILLVIVGSFAVYFHFSKDLPKLDTLEDYNPLVVSEIFSDDGTLIGEFWKEKRYLLSTKELPRTVIEAVVASEDDRFFKHKGIDLLGILRAFLKNLKAGHVVEGGSTITQQVTKSLLLTKERKISRKIKEAILATRIEKKFSKDEILYLYLNQIFFGNRSYGIEAAARNYFQKGAKELNIAEAAMIAGLAKAPSTFSPFANAKRAKTRQEYVIQRMYEVGYITEEQAQKAKAYRLKVYKAGTDKFFNLKHAPWFTENIRRYIQEKYGEQVPYTHGLSIYTTLDLKMQKAADLAVSKGLRELDHRQGYLGVLGHLQKDAIADFNKKTHLEIVKDEIRTKDPFNPITDEQLVDVETPIQNNKLYKAVVIDLDDSNNVIHVQIGDHKGLVKIDDYKWARTRNTNTAGYEDVTYIKKPSSKFNVGDIILVAKKIPSENEKTKLGYQANESYFSLEQIPEAEAALFSYDPHTGFVRAIVGGKDFESSEFNRAMQSLRQTGSVFKPFLYAAALDKGYTLDTVIDDSPIYYEYSPGRFWSPQNYGGGYKGPTSFRSALVASRNVISVRIAMDIGTEYTTAFIRKLGITTPIKRYYSMALGANDMKLFEVARAFGTFVTGGVLPELIYVKKMTDRYGRILETHEPKEILSFKEQLKKNSEKTEGEKAGTEFNDELLKTGEEWIAKENLVLTEVEKKILYGRYIPEGYAISPRNAYTMVQLLNDIVNFGTGYKVRELKRPAGGKTGTTNDESDAWFVGFTPNLVTGVWVGFDKVKKIGSRETGGKTAAPIFLYYNQEALKDQEVAQFDIPKEINDATLKAPINTIAGGETDTEAGGVSAGEGGAEFFIYDF